MAVIKFYEKPGCINNTKQKKLLRDAGHDVIEFDLIATNWDEASLLLYLGKVDIPQWFNKAAPRIKSGEIDPTNLNRADAIKLLLDDHLLIRRPLMNSGNTYRVGFDLIGVDAWVGLNQVQSVTDSDLESCPNENVPAH